MSTTLAPAIELPTLDLTGRDSMRDGYGDSFYRNTHFNGRGEFSRYLNQFRDGQYETDWRTTYLPSMAMSIWNEAHNELAHRERNRITIESVTSPLTPEEEDWEQELTSGAVPDHKLAKLRALIESNKQLKSTVSELEQRNGVQSARITSLLNEQILGDDDRLRDFWAAAHDVANDEGYCEVFDRMAERLNGPQRRRDARIRVTVTQTYYVTRELTTSEFDSDDFEIELEDLEGYEPTSEEVDAFTAQNWE